MAQALYRKYRSKALGDIVGQDHITNTLHRALAADRVAHAYLFTGPRGVGKTSIARILAHEINGLPYTDESTHLDIIEIDAASNNGVEDVRDLREKAQLAPVSARKKIYIIDEVHMLSKPAFNALLKTLEEPPDHIVFILATTDVEKLPDTIVSRTQQFRFRSIAPQVATAHLKAIAAQEGIFIDDAAVHLIAERGDGSFRDSISLLDQVASLSTKPSEKISLRDVEALLGLAPVELISEVLEAAEAGNVEQIAALLTHAEADGISPLSLQQQLITQVRQRLTSTPSFLGLLDSLLEVSKSSIPSIKLLTVLGLYAVQKQPKKPVKHAALAAPVREIRASVASLKKKPQPKPGVLDWDAVVTYTKEHFVALYSVVVKCTPSLEGSDLTLYCVNAFYKKKLDDPKYRAHLYESLEKTGSFNLTVHTLPTGAPIKDSQTAAIAAIMGGGVEVSVETSS